MCTVAPSTKTDMQETSRLTYIGGSDIVKILGVSESGDWTDVWKRLKYNEETKLDEEEHRDLLRGKVIEPHIEGYVREHLDPSINAPVHFERYDTENDFDDLFWNEFDHGNPWNGSIGETNGGTRTQIFARDTMQEYLGGHIDGVGDEMIWEMKAPRTYNVEYMNTYGVDKAYIAQCQFYMMITGKPRGAIAIWDYNSWTPNVLYIKRDEHMQRVMRTLTRNLWESLENDTVPDLTWQRKMGFMHIYDMEEIDGVVEEFVTVREARKLYEDREKALKPHIMTAVHSVWPDDEKSCQFLTKNHKVKATMALRGETPYVVLTANKNETQKETPRSEG